MRTASDLALTGVVPLAERLEYTTDSLAGGYASVRSWAHVDSIGQRVSAQPRGWLLVHRREDAAHRFAQLRVTASQSVLEVGALDATTGRHTIWQLRRAASTEGVTATLFTTVARDWLLLGVVPGWSATVVPIDGDDEPF